MSATRVVNIMHARYDVYIGRAGQGEDGYFGNPYARGKLCRRCHEVHASATSTLVCYAAYLHERLQTDAQFAAKIMALEGKVLGCFCRPVRGFSGRILCHGQIIAAHIEGISYSSWLSPGKHYVFLD